MIATRVRVSQPVPSVVFLTVQGRLDMDSSRQVQEAARQALAAPGVRSLAFQLAGCDFLDSSGLATLMGLQNQMRRRGGSVVLVRACAALVRTLTVAGEDERFRVFATEGEALQSLLNQDGTRW